MTTLSNRISLWLTLLLLLSTATDSFLVLVQRIHPRRPLMIPGQSSSYRTKLGLFWFGGGKDDESKKRKGEAASGFGGVAQVMDSMENFKKAQQVGKITEGILQELSSMSVEGSAEDGKVRVFFDGTQRPKSVDIDETYMSSVEADDLEAALAAAMKDAHAKSKEKMEEKMKSFYAELGLASSANNS